MVLKKLVNLKDPTHGVGSIKPRNIQTEMRCEWRGIRVKWTVGTRMWRVYVATGELRSNGVQTGSNFILASSEFENSFFQISDGFGTTSIYCFCKWL